MLGRVLAMLIKALTDSRYGRGKESSRADQDLGEEKKTRTVRDLTGGSGDPDTSQVGPDHVTLEKFAA